MAPKINILERCKDCGALLARLVKDGIAWNPSACTCYRGDGPQSPPRKLSFHSANFVPDDSSLPMVTSAVQAQLLIAVDPKAETVELPVVPEIVPTTHQRVAGDVAAMFMRLPHDPTMTATDLTDAIADILRRGYKS